MNRAVFITGPAGSGKTAHCLRVCSEALKKSRPGRIVYLVPSPEFASDIERELLLRCGCQGIVGPLVMDFSALAVRILKEAGAFPVRTLGPLERKYLIVRIVRETPLSFFKDARNYEGFAEVVADFISELKRGMISPGGFLRACLAASGRGAISREKVHDLYAIYRAYHDALAASGAYDRDGLLWKAAEILADNHRLLSRVEVLLVDGFATYTPVEFEILAQLAARARESHVTLCYEHGRPDVFAFVEGTYAALKGLCKSGEIVLNENRRASGALFHLERGLFAEPNKEVSAAAAVSILRCSDPYREAESIAREIRRIREQDGLEYGDFLVIFREPGEYLRAITEVFGEERIPFYLPAAGSLADEPFIRAVASVLRLLKGEFRREDVLALLKSSYLNFDMDLAATIENYADELGLWGEEEFRKPWVEAAQTAREVAPLNDYKNRFLATLDKLRSEARLLSSADEFRRFIFRAISELGFLSRGEKTAQCPGDRSANHQDFSPPFSSEYRSLAVLARLLDVLCEHTRLVGLGRCDYSLLLDMLEQGLRWMPLPPPPKDLNAVRIAPITGGPPPEAPVVFVCGLCERSFPKEIVNEPFFKDRERRRINRQGTIFLHERLPLSCGERFFFYIAVSRAIRRLVLTCPAADGAGEEIPPSRYLEEVAALFSDLKDAVQKEAPSLDTKPVFTDLGSSRDVRSFVAHRMSLATTIAEDAWDENSALAALTYNELLTLGAFGPDWLIYQVGDVALAHKLSHAFQQTGPYLTSASELETFAACPFRHFCEYRLHLKELPRYEFGPTEEGSLYHDVLAKLFREIYLPPRGSPLSTDDDSHRRPAGIESFSPEELDRRLTSLVDQFIAARYARLFLTPRMQVRRRALQAKICAFVSKEVENQLANATRPAYFELSFGRGKSHLNADDRSTDVPLLIGEKDPPLLRLSGRMDRVDVFDKEGEMFGVVLDYKRSEQASKSDLRRGTILQPGIYMLALEELFGIKPAGAFYYAISSARKRGIFAAEEEEPIAGRGDVSRTDKASYQEIRDLITLNVQQALGYVKRILDGEIAVRPAEPEKCRACPFLSLCRVTDTALSP